VKTSPSFEWKLAEQNFPCLEEYPLQLWLISLKNFSEIGEKLYSMLHEEEKLKAQNFYFEKNRLQFVGLRAALRILISKNLKLKYNDIQICYNKNEKPYINNLKEGKFLYFNVSHSHELGAIALSTQNEIGVDIEHMNSARKFDAIVRRHFSLKEQAYVGEVEEEKMARFYQLWTAKEALLKAIGHGLWQSLSEVEIPLFKFAEHQVVQWKDYSLLSLPCPFVCAQMAIAIKGEMGSLLKVQTTLQRLSLF